MILLRALWRDMAGTAAAVLVLLVGITVGARLGGYLTEAVDGRLDPELVGRVLLLRLPEFLLLLLPLAFHAGVILTLARWRADRELVVLHAAGVGPGLWLRLGLLWTLPVCLLCLWLAQSVVPAAKAQLAELFAEQRISRVAVVGQPGRFHVLAGGERTLWIDAVDPVDGHWSGVFLYQHQGDSAELVTARRGEWRSTTAGPILALQDGERLRLAPPPLAPVSVRFHSLVQRLPPPALRATGVEAEAGAVLRQQTTAAARAEWHWRLALSGLPLLLWLTALAVLARPAADVPYRGLIAAIVLALLQVGWLVLARAWATSGSLSPLQAYWLPAALMAALATATVLGRRPP